MPANARTKSIHAYSVLKEALKSGSFGSGERLTEASVAKKLGVSRVPVREAFLKLEAEGLLKGRGPYMGKYCDFIEDAEPEEAVKRYEIREVIEGLAARTAAMHMTGLEIQKLRSHAEKTLNCLEKGNWEGLHRNNRTFHEFLMEHCGNPLLHKMWQVHHLMPFSTRSVEVEAKIRAQVQGPDMQMALVDAIASHDPDVAESSMRGYIAQITDAIRKALVNQ